MVSTEITTQPHVAQSAFTRNERGLRTRCNPETEPALLKGCQLDPLVGGRFAPDKTRIYTRSLVGRPPRLQLATAKARSALRGNLTKTKYDFG